MCVYFICMKYIPNQLNCLASCWVVKEIRPIEWAAFMKNSPCCRGHADRLWRLRADRWKLSTGGYPYSRLGQLPSPVSGRHRSTPWLRQSRKYMYTHLWNAGVFWVNNKLFSKILKKYHIIWCEISLYIIFRNVRYIHIIKPHCSALLF